ncbi:MAG TPA: DUF3857 domain-containing protein, partial [Polyangiaceae bacterium]
CSKGRPLTPATLEQPERWARQKSEREFPVHIELTRFVYELRADGTYDRTIQQRYRVLTPEGVEEWSASRAYWSPWYMKRPRLSATVVNRQADGSAARFALNPATITEQPTYPEAPEIYSDARVLRAPLPSVSVGSVVDEVIKTTTHRPFLSKEHMHSVPFQIGIPQDRVELVVEAPSDLPVHFDVREAAVTRTETTKNGRTRTTFTGGPYAGIELPELFTPSNVPSWPSVDFGTGDDWRPLARQYGAIVDQKLAGVDFATTVNQVVTTSDSDFTKASKLYNWVKSKVRYVGIEFGESGVVPHAPDQTVARAYGDCKDQATLLVGLLRAAGLPAHVALLSVGSREDINGKLAALNVFDHAIVVVLGEEPWWFDPTADHVEPGALPPSDQGRLALVAGPDTEALVRTPSATPAANTYSEHREVFLGSYGLARVIEHSQGRGFQATELRDTFDQPRADIDENMQRYARETYYTDKVEKLAFGETENLLKPFEVKLEAPKSAVGYTALLDASVEAREHVLWSWLPSELTESEGERKATLVLPVPYRAELIWEIHAPAGLEPSKLPEATTLRLGPASLTRTVEKRADGVIVKSTFTTGKAQFSASDVREFRSAYQRYQRTSVETVEFLHAAKKLSDAGKPKAAVALIDREIAAHPRDPFARLRRALLLLPYAKDAAHAEGRAAAQLDPDDARLQKELANLLAQNQFGADLGLGYDRGGALAAYERAFALDAEDTESRLRAAVVLEHDARGTRYASSDLDRAIAIYDSVPEEKLEEYADGAFRDNALFALYWAKRHQELEQRLARRSREAMPVQLAVMNAAALRGAPGARAETERLTLSGQELADALEAASGALAQKRQYADAAELAQAAIASGSSQKNLQARVRILKKTRQIDAASLPEGTPEEFVTKLFAQALSQQADVDTLARRFLAQGAWYQPGKSSVKGALEGLSSGGSVRQGILGQEFMADLAVSSLEFRVDGSAKTGYRVFTKIEQGASRQYNIYVVKEAGKYKLRAFGDQRGELGAEAFAAVSAGDEKRARQWLDWAREAYHAAGGEDPLRVAPFARLYDEGKGDVRLAAAALAAASFHSPLALPMLEKALQATSDPDRRHIIEDALVGGYANAKQHDKQLALVQTLHQALPKSRVARDGVFEALWQLERYDDYVKSVERQLKLADTLEHPMLKSRLAAGRTAQNKFGEARRLHQELIDSGKANGDTYNNNAWLGLFLGSTASDVEWAEKAVELGKGSGAMHTLACLYADRGQLDEARRAFEQLLLYRDDRQPEGIDWFILGRMAEELGLRQTARESYAKVTKPERPWPTSTYALAQKRLAALAR